MTVTMSKTETMSDEEIDLLDAFLLSDHVHESAMTLSELDGFLTGILTGPELILPSEWMSIVWGKEPPDFESVEQAETVSALIIARYNQINQGLRQIPPALEPLIMEDRNGDLLGEIWATGFVTAIEIRANAWMPIFDTDYAAAVSLIMALADPDRLSDVTEHDEAKSVLLNSITSELPTTIAAIQTFWEQARSSQS